MEELSAQLHGLVDRERRDQRLVPVDVDLRVADTITYTDGDPSA